MDSISSSRAMAQLSAKWRKRGHRIGFVPTMGSLHEGHFSLIRLARRQVSAAGKVLVSIYVNPAQFGPGEDYRKYPRDLEADCRMCEQAGADAVFAPLDSEIYGNPGTFSTWVIEEKLSQPMEGICRPGHFRGVTTIVAKLFSIIAPHLAVFGEKDYQQAAVIRRMVANLQMPVEIVIGPTFRETDGLALSSRNRYLTPRERRRAGILWQAIELAREEAAKKPAVQKLKQQITGLLKTVPQMEIDYVEIRDESTLQPVSQLSSGGRLFLAVRLGRTRLIDNAALGYGGKGRAKRKKV